MRIKHLVIAVGIVALAVSAAAFDVAFFYGPSVVIGGAADDAPVGPAGLACRFGAGEGYWRLAAGAGFADYEYGNHYTVMIPEDKEVENVPTIVLSAGADIGLPLGRWRPYVGGGAALALQIYDLQYETRAEEALGLFTQAGVRCRLSEKWALEAAPRYTYLWDERIEIYDFINRDGIHRTDERSTFVDIFVGFDYSF